MSATEHVPDLFAGFLGGPRITPRCTGEADLLLHDPLVSDDCWIAMQDAPHLRAWR